MSHDKDKYTYKDVYVCNFRMNFFPLSTYIFILKSDCQITEWALLSVTYHQVHQKLHSTWGALLPKQAKYTLLQCTQAKLSWSSEFDFPLLSSANKSLHKETDIKEWFL